MRSLQKAGGSFFDGLFFKNKDSYKVGDAYTFALSALVHDIEVVTGTTFSLEGDEAIDFLQKNGKIPRMRKWSGKATDV